jgi:type I site-specific restriction endonuclease
MKRFAVLFFLAAQWVCGLTYEQTKMLYERKVGELEQAAAAAVGKLAEGYQGELEKLLNNATRAGKLEEALAIKEEMERIGKGEYGEEPEFDAAKNARMLAERKRFDEARGGVMEKLAGEKLDAEDKYVDLLEMQVKDLTRQNDLEKAVIAQKELTAIQEERAKLAEAEALKKGLSPEQLVKKLMGTRWTYDRRDSAAPMKTHFQFTSETVITFRDNYLVSWEAQPGRKIKTSRPDWKDDGAMVFDEKFESYVGTSSDGGRFTGERIKD